MKSPIAVTLFAATAAMALTSCASEPEPQPTAQPITSAEETPSLPPLPTAAELNDDIGRGFDPSVPLAEKVEFVQGAQDDPALIDQVVAAAEANAATVNITSVDDLGDGTLSAGATLTIAGQPNEGTMIFVAEDGVWKLSRENACALVGIAGLVTAACPS